MSPLIRVLRRTFSTTPILQLDSVRKVADGLYKERDLKRLVEKFKRSCEYSRFRNRNGIYEDIVRRLASAGRFRWIEEILEDQKKYEDMSKEGFAARLIHLYGKAGMFEQAYKVFDEMPKRGLLSFNALMGACVNAKNFDDVDRFFRDLPPKLSIEPDLVSYNTVIKAFCEMGSLDSARLMLDDEMEKKGVQPDVITFNTLLDHFFKNGKLDDGEKIWAKMAEKNVEPDIRSYNSKLLGFATEKRMKEAVNLVEEMRSKGVKLDVFTFTYMIRGFVNDGKLEEAKDWYSQIGKNDCAPDKLTFTILVPFVCEKGDLSFAIELCKEIFDRKKLVDVALLQRVVDDLVEASKIEDAKELVKLAKENTYRLYKLNMPAE
ncbi:Pentatricopeptide repeat-containing protein [Hibiscus syriacus]|uniref:Pentatricopeptide repeat-containing protein n=1 Tax=Hibiscus syriacus TaxID=106335 RepID=A0A6A2ZD92_HIBSY|nr:pentatricopeptide repeat-containing protein At1g55890, mitochondrial-like [Hibiscus syriacus]KAE8689717.1 Pentatricopeptide repeat-containing protein [Hibiscus syriacus]